MFSAASSAASTPRTPALAAGGSKTGSARPPPPADFRVVHNPAFSAEAEPSPRSGGEPPGGSLGRASLKGGPESIAALAGARDSAAAESSNGARREAAATAEKVKVPSWSASGGPAPRPRPQQPSRLATGGGSGPLAQQLPRPADSSSNRAPQEPRQLLGLGNGSSSEGVDDKQEVPACVERRVTGTPAASSEDSHTSQGERSEGNYVASFRTSSLEGIKAHLRRREHSIFRCIY